MKKLVFLLGLCLLVNTAYAQSGNEGGGGGVLKRDGQYLTFGSAGLKVKLSTPQGLTEIPSINLLLSVLEGNQDLSKDILGEVVMAIVPQPDRRYFKIDQSQLQNGTYNRLIAEYAKLWKGQVDPKNLDLAAITIEQDTFLLPPFFRLKPAEQAAILFHESLWILKPDIKYAELVNAEIVMQKHIEKFGAKWTYDADLIAVLGDVLGLQSYSVLVAIQQDLLNGKFQKYGIKGHTISSSTLYYELSDILPGDRQHERGQYLDYNIYFVDLRNALLKYPELTFLQLLYSYGKRIETSTKFGWFNEKSKMSLYKDSGFATLDGIELWISPPQENAH